MFSDNPESLLQAARPCEVGRNNKKKHLEIIIGLSSLFPATASFLRPNKPLMFPLPLNYSTLLLNMTSASRALPTTAYLFARATPGISDVTHTGGRRYREVSISALTHFLHPRSLGRKAIKATVLVPHGHIFQADYTLFNSAKCTEAQVPLRDKCCMILHAPQGGGRVHN